MRGAGRVAAQQQQRRPTQCVPSAGRCSGPASCSRSASAYVTTGWPALRALRAAGFWPEGKEGRGGDRSRRKPRKAYIRLSGGPQWKGQAGQQDLGGAL